MNKMDLETVDGIIYDIFNHCDEDERYELTDGFYLKYHYDGNFWNCGIALYKEDEDEPIETYKLDHFAESLADLLEEGQMIIESMARAIIEKMEEK